MSLWDKVTERGRASETIGRRCVYVCLNLPSPLVLFQVKTFPTPWPCFVAADTHLLSRSVLISAPPPQPPSLFSLLPYLTKARCHLLRSSFLPSPFIPRPLPLLRLSIKPTKGGRRSVQKDPSLFFSSSSSMAAPFLSAPISLLSVFYPLSSSSSPSIPLSHPLCVFPLSWQ